MRKSRVWLDQVTIRDNTGLLNGTGYPGIVGLMLREGADVLVTRSTFTNNSWDAITVFADGKLRLFGSRIAKGKGVAVGVTQDGTAVVVNNDISGYWKGIAALVNARVSARNNFVHHQVGWGVASSGDAVFDLYNNTIAFNDLVGAVLTSPNASGAMVNNVIAHNGLYRHKAYPENTWGRAGIRGPGPAESKVRFDHNAFFGNERVDWLRDGTGATVDPSAWGTSRRIAGPLFVSETDLRPAPGSPLVDSGSPDILDANGTRSDLGATGGPDVGRTEPSWGD